MCLNAPHTTADSVEGWPEDRDMLRELVKIYAKTNGFETPQTMTFCGVRVCVRDSFFEMCRRELSRIVSTRGIEWASAMTVATFVLAVQSRIH